MNATPTLMAQEIAEAPEAVARFFDRESAALAEVGAQLARLGPPVVVTCARGSSDHASAYFKYLVEILNGTPVASLGPSLASIYKAPLRLKGWPRRVSAKRRSNSSSLDCRKMTSQSMPLRLSSSTRVGTEAISASVLRASRPTAVRA